MRRIELELSVVSWWTFPMSVLRIIHQLNDSNPVQESEAFWNKIQSLEQEKLADSEKVRQQKDLLEQAREDASTTEQLHLEEINQLYNTINGVKTEYETLSDDEIIGQMRKLHHHLEAWVKTNFRDAQKLGMLMDQTDGEYPRSSHQRRALIQAFVTDMINTMVFAPYHLGMAKQCGDALATVEHAVQQRCTSTLSSFHPTTY